MKRYYQETADDIITELSSSTDGLSGEEAQRRLGSNGPNEIQTEKRDSAVTIFMRQFRSFIVLILFLTAGISWFIDHTIEFIVILIIILFIVLLNFFMEWGAAREMDSLIKLAPKKTRVLRDGAVTELHARELVPGDIITLQRGDIVGADARVIWIDGFSVDESALTGESVPVHKQSGTITAEADLAKQVNMVFSGTPVTSGSAKAVVVATGDQTEFGKISKLIQGVKKQKTPLQDRLDHLSRQLAGIVFVLALGGFLMGLYHGIHWAEMLIFSMAIIVAGIPESLPTVVGICLAGGVKKMSREDAIVKRLPAVETLGTCSVICTDKTGTLTENRMIVENIYTADAEVDVTGQGYKPEGRFLKDKEEVDVNTEETVSKAIQAGLLCNNSDINQQDDEWVVDGEPTEGALVTIARKAGMQKAEYDTAYPRTREIAFDSHRKMMSVVNSYDGRAFVHTKGAPELVLERAGYYLKNGEVKPLGQEVFYQFLKQNHEYASKGYRVLAVAYREMEGPDTAKDVESDLIMLGLLAIRDPPDSLTFDSIAKCKEAGIRPVMITGDSKTTAAAIARELGILTDEDNILTGEELDTVVGEEEEKEFFRMVGSVAVFARATPEHKLRIVEALQKKGHVVAMTGDGVNDAPALKKSDIGIAMGERGSEVAKESSELILKDDKFSTIVKAVESGRNIYSNIRKFIYYLLVGSFSEVLLILFAILVGMELPLTALMVLFINLATCEFPAIGLSLEKSGPHIMRQRPRDPSESILNDFVITRIFGTAPILILGTLALYIWELFKTGEIKTAQTIAFTTIILFELLHAFNTKSWNDSIVNRGIFSNMYLNLGVLISFVLMMLVIYVPTLQSIFGTVPLELGHWLHIILVASSILFFIELKKYVLKVEMKERQKFQIHPTRE